MGRLVAKNLAVEIGLADISLRFGPQDFGAADIDVERRRQIIADAEIEPAGGPGIAQQRRQIGVVDGPALIVRAHVRTARSEEQTSELQSLMRISYAVFCLKKKTNTTIQ